MSMKKFKKLLSVMLLLAMLTALAAPAACAEGETAEPASSEQPQDGSTGTGGTETPEETADSEAEKTIHISTREDLEQLASDCRLDVYSVGLTVILDNDIDLGGEPFTPIPSFSGTFKGNGHTISGFVCGNDGSHQGFFRYIEESGVVTGLTVTGEVLPQDSRTDIGGLVGTNRGTISSCSFSGTVSGLINIGGIAGENYGKMIDCSFSGTVSGKQFTGGIVGYSEGKLVRCLNSGEVNTTVVEEAIDVEQLSLLDLTNLDLVQANDSNVVSDTGGIAGMSTGVVTACKNTGTVGYQHYGYNVGGIIGRQSGYVNACINYGTVYGRTDVGGIIGQMEPYLILTDRDSLSDALEDLSASTENALGNLSKNASEAGGTMNTMEGQASTLATDTQTMENTKDKVEGNDDDDSESSVTAEDVANKAGEIGGSISDAAGNVDQGTVDDIASGNVTGDDISDIVDAASDPTEQAVDNIDQRIQEKKAEKAEDEENYDNSKTTVSNDLSGMASTLGKLNQQLSTGTIQLSSDLSVVSGNFNRVMTLISNALTGEYLKNVYEDISEWDSDDNTDGKVSECTNNAPVSGDDNVGGIAGNMGVENEYDMNGVISEVAGNEGIFSNTYKSKCIVRNCENNGTVTGKKCNIGGIVGLSKMGSVFDSENYGNVVSTNGNYVGGVVGYSYTYIENSYAICNLEGVEYIGGIAGYGTRVVGCVSLVGLTGEGGACIGAICGFADVSAQEELTDEKGDATGEYGDYLIRGNMFVDNGMGAVDGISYSGRAEPVLYSEILQKEDLPETFSTLKLSYVADGNLVKEIVFEYGGTIDQNAIPEVPEKAGYTGYWEDYDYSALYFSDTVEAIYVANKASLAVQDARDGSPMSILLVEGEFQDGASVTMEEYTGSSPELSDNETLLEAWTLNLEDNEEGTSSYTVRYLPPETEKNQSVEIYILNENGVWQNVSVQTSGSYTVFTADGTDVTFAAVAKTSRTALLVILVAAAVLAAGAAVYLLLKHRKNQPVTGPDDQGDETPDTPADSSPDETPEEETPGEVPADRPDDTTDDPAEEPSAEQPGEAPADTPEKPADGDPNENEPAEPAAESGEAEEDEI